MGTPKRFDVAIIGAGTAGFAAATAARKLGASVVLIERDRLGGACPDWAILRSARAMRDGQDVARFGVEAKPAVSWNQVKTWRDKTLERLTGERYVDLAKQLGVEVLHGDASFVEPTILQVGAEFVSVKSVVMATGGQEEIPEIAGLDQVPYATSRTLFDRATSVPKSVVIVGGDTAACEYATFFSAMGSRVTLVQSESVLLSREDADVSAAVQAMFEARGVEVITRATITEAVNGRGVYGVRATVEGKEVSLPCNLLLLAAGKRAATTSLHLAEVGITADDQGFIRADDTCRTNQKQVFAAGDCTGGLMLTQVAEREGTVAGTNAAMVAKGKRAPLMKRKLTVVPRVTLTDLEVASVGMTEAEVKTAWKKAIVGRCEMRDIGRAVVDGVEEGFVKVVAHPKTEQILGVHVIGPRAGEMIHEAALAITLKAKVSQVAEAIHAYPTYSEALVVAAASVHIS